MELHWMGKDVRTRREPAILIEAPDLSYFPGGQALDNRLIRGDNLVVLKALEPEFAGRVTCVVIDPPYNTGGAFAQYDDEVAHATWLGLMRERLVISKNLMAEAGSLWITIDDHESHYLKVLCDEIFGRGNFISNVVWQKKYTIANDARWLSDNHDHILVYAKNKDLWRPNKLPRTQEMNARYKNPDAHPKGAWKATPLHAKSGSHDSQQFCFTFKNGLAWRPPAGTFPRFNEATMRRLDDGDEIWFGKTGAAVPARKTFLSELAETGTPSPTIWLHTATGHNHEAREEVKFFNADHPFDTPKPERLLHRILHLATQPGDLVLDCFAGSGTTGAVAHKMGRRWIMVELGDHCRTHVAPRLRMVIDGEDPNGVTRAMHWQGGGGFRYYELAKAMP